jgi:hypothetical protein
MYNPEKDCELLSISLLLIDRFFIISATSATSASSAEGNFLSVAPPAIT